MIKKTVSLEFKAGRLFDPGLPLSPPLTNPYSVTHLGDGSAREQLSVYNYLKGTSRGRAATLAKGCFASLPNMDNFSNSTDQSTVLSPVVIGRARELDVMARALEIAAKGKSQCLILAGEAGVGKSRLLAEVRGRAVDRFLILQGSCFEQDIAFPYAVVIDLLRTFAAQHSAGELREAWGVLGAELVKLLPELAWTLPEVRPTPALEAEAEKRRLFEALAQWLGGLAHTRSLLLIFEDLHWSDEASLDFLLFFLRRQTASPVCMLLTYRFEDAPPPLTRLLAQLDREHLAREITLRPLMRDEVDLMLRAIFTLDHPVRVEFLDAIVRLTDGNPFFIEEILKDLAETGALAPGGAGRERRLTVELRTLHARSVQDAVQRRLALLSDAARSIISLAAAAGRRFDFDLLQQMTGHDEAALLRIMKECTCRAAGCRRNSRTLRLSPCAHQRRAGIFHAQKPLQGHRRERDGEDRGAQVPGKKARLKAIGSHRTGLSNYHSFRRIWQ